MQQLNDNKYWYIFLNRGLSIGCQPKGFIDHDDSIGNHGIVAYDRLLTKKELYEYELQPYNFEG